MNMKFVRELLAMVEASSVEELEVEQAGVRVRIKKPSATIVGAVRQPDNVSAPLHTMAAEGAPAHQAPAHPPNLHVFRSPMVGTFYSAAKPDTPPFVRVGDRVHKGTVICIIEAMKLFNQIEADVSGEVVRVLVGNQQPVEFGEPLFEIRLDDLRDV